MDIRLLLVQNGITARNLSRELGYRQADSVSFMLNRQELSPRTKQLYRDAIKRIIEKEAKERDIKINRNED